MAAQIEISGLTKHYRLGDETVVALDAIDLAIEAGSMTAVMGPSGSGKSTLMNLLGLLDTPTGGSYRIAGAEVAGLSDAERSRARRERIGFIFQSFNLLPRRTALDNVALPLLYAGVRPDERAARARALLEGLGLGDRLRHRPTELSGGQQQRVAIARALVNDPALVLADEPTGNLDRRTGREVLELLVELRRRGRTIVIVTHDREVAEHAGRIVTLVDGRIVADELAGSRPAPAGSPLAERARQAWDVLRGAPG